MAAGLPLTLLPQLLQLVVRRLQPRRHQQDSRHHKHHHANKGHRHFMHGLLLVLRPKSLRLQNSQQHDPSTGPLTKSHAAQFQYTLRGSCSRDAYTVRAWTNIRTNPPLPSPVHAYTRLTPHSLNPHPSTEDETSSTTIRRHKPLRRIILQFPPLPFVLNAQALSRCGKPGPLPLVRNFDRAFPQSKRAARQQGDPFYGRQFQRRQSHQNSLVQE